jgi:hypothetical protein
VTAGGEAVSSLGARLRVAVSPRSSLRRQATRARISHLPRRVRLVERARLARERASASIWSHLGLLVLPVGVLFLPLGDAGLGGPLDNTDDARGFLSTLWQVDAAAIGLTLAFVIFALQMAVGAERREGLRLLVASTGVLYLFTVGVGVLILIGVTLLDHGAGAPAGWAATWCVVVSLIGALSLVGVVVRTLPLLEPERLFRLRLGRLKREVQATVDAVVHRHYARAALARACEAAGIRQIPSYLAGSRRGQTVLARRAGQVHDILLPQLQALVASTCGDADAAQTILCVGLGDTVRSGDTVFILPPEASPQAVRAAERALILGHEARLQLTPGLDRLNEAAISAIGERARGRLVEIQSALLEVLTSFAAAWARYGERFERDADPDHPLGLGALHRLEVDLLQQVREALVADPELVSTALSLPWRIAMDGHRADAPALTWGALRALRTAVSSSWSLAAPEGDEVREAAREALWGYVNYALAPALRDAEDDGVERERGYVDAAFRVLGDMSREAVDLGAVSFLEALDGGWRQVDTPIVSPLAGPDAPERWLPTRRSAYRLGLLAWLLRRVESQALDAAHAQMASVLARGHGRLEEVLHTGDAALALQEPPWTRWQIAAGGPGVHTVPPFGPGHQLGRPLDRRARQTDTNPRPGPRVASPPPDRGQRPDRRAPARRGGRPNLGLRSRAGRGPSRGAGRAPRPRAC